MFAVPFLWIESIHDDADYGYVFQAHWTRDCAVFVVPSDAISSPSSEHDVSLSSFEHRFSYLNVSDVSFHQVRHPESPIFHRVCFQ
jgi:hypothetical protein